MEFPYENTVTSSDGVSICYKVQGSGTPALVFVHGWACNKTYWDKQVVHFARNYQVVALDLAGHGDSGINRKKWTMAAFGDDVHAVVNKLGIDQIILVGHSMGGPVCLEAAQRLQDRVVAIVGVDTFLYKIYQKWTKEEYDKYIAMLKPNFVEAVYNLVRQEMFIEKSDPTLIERIASDMSAAPPLIGIGAFEELTKWDLSMALQSIKVPIRCINAPFSDLDLEARYAPYIEVVYMPDVGHFVMLEDPTTFNQLLTEVIQELVHPEDDE